MLVYVLRLLPDGILDLAAECVNQDLVLIELVYNVRQPPGLPTLSARGATLRFGSPAATLKIAAVPYLFSRALGEHKYDNWMSDIVEKKVKKSKAR
jgi:hypothetical protein